MESSFLAMVRPGAVAFTGHMTEPTHYSPGLDHVVEAIAERSYGTLAAVSPNGLGTSLPRLIRDPVHAGGTVELEAQATKAHR
jgi:hypothetical protein